MGKKIKTTCHICTQVIKAEEAPSSCTRCGANLVNTAEETVTKQSQGQYSKGKLGGEMGYFYLTNKRLVWIRNGTTGTGALVGGLVGALVETAVNKAAGGNKLGFSLDLTNIKSVEDGKFGLLVKAIIINTKDGESYKIGPKKLADWKETLSGYASYGSNL